MKKLIYIAIAAIFVVPAMAQPVSDRGVIPVAVTLNQILRLNITNGGNIEFVFNTIGQYQAGIGVPFSAFYQTDFNVASSTRWELFMGAEDATFFGTDDPTAVLALDNVGFTLDDTPGIHKFGTELTPAVAILTVLAPFPGAAVIGSAAAPVGNSGDIDDNDFFIHWECGTGVAPMNLVPLIDQDITPDRYVTNVLLDIAVAP